jgi:hypothetical protein
MIASYINKSLLEEDSSMNSNTPATNLQYTSQPVLSKCVVKSFTQLTFQLKTPASNKYKSLKKLPKLLDPNTDLLVSRKSIILTNTSQKTYLISNQNSNHKEVLAEVIKPLLV